MEIISTKRTPVRRDLKSIEVGRQPVKRNTVVQNVWDTVMDGWKFRFQAGRLLHRPGYDRQTQIPAGYCPTRIRIRATGQAIKDIQYERSQVRQLLGNMHHAKSRVVGFERVEIIIPRAGEFIGDHPSTRSTVFSGLNQSAGGIEHMDMRERVFTTPREEDPAVPNLVEKQAVSPVNMRKT